MQFISVSELIGVELKGTIGVTRSAQPRICEYNTMVKKKKKCYSLLKKKTRKKSVILGVNFQWQCSQRYGHPYPLSD